MSSVVRPHESGDPVAAVVRAHETGRPLALATSGTTGRTREVVRATRSWWSSFEAYADLAGLDAGSRLWVPGPTTSTMNLFALVHARVAGIRVVDRPEDATAAALTPARLDRAAADLRPGTRVVTAGAALPPALAARATGRGLRLEHYYGAAELSFVAWAGPDGLRPFPGVEVEVRDEPVARTVWVRSPYLADGYLGEPGSLRRDRDGWATVGDLGTLAGGVLTLLGRPDAVTTAGATVLVADVEAALRAVAHGDLAVHPTPHATLGEVVTVTLVDPTDRDRLERWARANLPASHRPRRWEVASTLPLTAAGKVDRPRLARDAG